MDDSAKWLDDAAEGMEDEGLDRENNARHFRAGAAAIKEIERIKKGGLSDSEIFKVFIQQGAENHTHGAGVPFIKMDTSVLYRSVRFLLERNRGKHD